MTNFLLIGICILAGMLFRRSNTLPADAHKGINAFIIYLALPAVSFKYLPHIKWDNQLLLAALAPVIVWVAAWLYVTVYGHVTGADKATVGGLKLTSGLCNTSFLGFPLIAAYFGEQYIGTAVICDQVSFILISVAGIIVAVRASQKQQLSAGLLVKRVLKFPPFLGCIGALIIPHFINLTPISALFDKLAATVGPMALFSIGLQLRFSGWREEVKHVSASLVYKLMLAPALIMLIALALRLRGSIAQISVFEMAMSGMLTTGIIADEYHLNPKLSNLIVGLGIVCCFVTSAFWWFAVTQWLA
ncbi:AEC family transporter [Mucilaginibacter koreensis]